MSIEIHERLSALATPAKTRILKLLSQEELSVTEVAQVVQLPQSTVSRHLKGLTESGWAQSRRAGNSVLFILSTELKEDDARLWSYISLELQERWADDRLRLERILLTRSASSRDFFSRLGHRWRDLRTEMFGEHYLTHLAFALIPRGQVIADLGCGTGDTLEHLAPRVDRVIGVDREPTMLDVARTRLARFDNVELREGEVESPPLQPKEIDLALMNLVLHLMEAPEEALTATAEALQSGGRVIILDMVRHQRKVYRRTMGHVHLGFDRVDLETLAQASALTLRSYQTLPPDLNATGPALSAAVLER